MNAIKGKSDTVKKTGSEVAETVCDGIKKEKKKFDTKGTEIVEWFIQGVKSKEKDIINAGEYIATKVISGIQNEKDNLIAIGRTIATYVIQGMTEKSDDVRRAAENWHDIIDKELSVTHYIEIEADSSALKDAAKEINDKIEDLEPVVTVECEFESGYPKQLLKDIENLEPEITVLANFARGELSDLKSSVEKINPVITAKVTASDLSSFGDSVKGAIVDALKKISLSVKKDDKGNLTLEAKAQGGIVSGDLFVANENGVPEMVGRFGNQTAVANNDQIVAGITNGVAAANSEQNALLRRQNELLLGILQKEGNVHIGASSALGRVVSQSMKMYGQMVGG